MKLDDYLNTLTAQTEALSRELTPRLDDLNQRLFESDCEMARKLEEIMEGQARRQCSIFDMMQTISARLGHMPAAEYRHRYVEGNPRAGLAAPQPQPPALPEYPVYTDDIASALQSAAEAETAAGRIFDFMAR